MWQRVRDAVRQGVRSGELFYLCALCEVVAMTVLVVAFPTLWPWVRPHGVWSTESVIVDGVTRHYRVADPHFREKTAPALIVFHGIGQTPEALAREAELYDLADEFGVVLVFPEALRSMWLADGKRGTENRDIAFFDVMVDELVRTHHINPKRVKVAGLSNGGTFALRLAMEQGHKIDSATGMACLLPQRLDTREPIVRSHFDLQTKLYCGTEDSTLPALRTQIDRANDLLKEQTGLDLDFDPQLEVVEGLGHAWPTSANFELTVNPAMILRRVDARLQVAHWIFKL